MPVRRCNFISSECIQLEEKLETACFSQLLALLLYVPIGIIPVTHNAIVRILPNSVMFWLRNHSWAMPSVLTSASFLLLQTCNYSARFLSYIFHFYSLLKTTEFWPVIIMCIIIDSCTYKQAYEYRGIWIFRGKKTLSTVEFILCGLLETCCMGEEMIYISQNCRIPIP